MNARAPSARRVIGMTMLLQFVVSFGFILLSDLLALDGYMTKAA